MFTYMTTDITRVDMTRVHTVEADGKEKRISERFERSRSFFMGLFRAEQQQWKRQTGKHWNRNRENNNVLWQWCKNGWENWHDIQMSIFCVVCFRRRHDVPVVPLPGWVSFHLLSGTIHHLQGWFHWPLLIFASQLSLTLSPVKPLHAQSGEQRA